jgi:hypothetical protein
MLALPTAIRTGIEVYINPSNRLPSTFLIHTSKTRDSETAYRTRDVCGLVLEKSIRSSYERVPLFVSSKLSTPIACEQQAFGVETHVTRC